MEDSKVQGGFSFISEMRAAGYRVTEWSNSRGETYAAHSHGYRKILCCLQGSITFHLPDGDLELKESERLDLAPGVVHSATVGPAGVKCAEAHVS